MATVIPFIENSSLSPRGEVGVEATIFVTGVTRFLLKETRRESPECGSRQESRARGAAVRGVLGASSAPVREVRETHARGSSASGSCSHAFAFREDASTCRWLGISFDFREGTHFDRFTEDFDRFIKKNISKIKNLNLDQILTDFTDFR